MSKRKKKLSKKQEETIAKMKSNRQIDSKNLRDIIIGKLEWAKAEKAKGEKAIKQIQFQVAKLEGIILFINELLQPPLEKKEEKK